MDEIEIWKDIINFVHWYMISNFGRVKSLARIIVRNNGRIQNVRERIRKDCIDGKGYHFIYLTKNGKRTSKKIARLVAEAFIPNPLNKPEVNHLFGKDDNRATSLEWVTGSENVRHSLDILGCKRAKGIKNNAAKLTEQQVREIRLLKGKMFQREIAKMYGVSRPIIGHIFKNEYWSHVV